MRKWDSAHQTVAGFILSITLLLCTPVRASANPQEPPTRLDPSAMDVQEWVEIIDKGGHTALVLLRAMTPEQLREFNDHNAVATFEYSSSSTPSLWRGSFAPSINPIEEECNTRAESVLAKSIGGAKLFEYSLIVTWCYEDNRITTTMYYRRAQVYATFWQFVGHIDAAAGGNRSKTWYQVYSQGHFKLCYLALCPSHWYPWARIEINGNGTSKGYKGG